MTDRQKQMIAGYLPHPRDPELDPLDYYVEDLHGIVQAALQIDYAEKGGSA